MPKERKTRIKKQKNKRHPLTTPYKIKSLTKPSALGAPLSEAPLRRERELTRDRDVERAEDA